MLCAALRLKHGCTVRWDRCRAAAAAAHDPAGHQRAGRRDARCRPRPGDGPGSAECSRQGSGPAGIRRRWMHPGRQARTRVQRYRGAGVCGLRDAGGADSRPRISRQHQRSPMEPEKPCAESEGHDLMSSPPRPWRACVLPPPGPRCRRRYRRYPAAVCRAMPGARGSRRDIDVRAAASLPRRAGLAPGRSGDTAARPARCQRKR
jgi:hypothetical protein